MCSRMTKETINTPEPTTVVAEGKQGDLFTELERSLPPAIARKDVPKILYGVMTAGWLANLDCAGRGPKSFKCGKIVVYTRGALIEWLRAMNEGGAV